MHNTELKLKLSYLAIVILAVSFAAYMLKEFSQFPKPKEKTSVSKTEVLVEEAPPLSQAAMAAGYELIVGANPMLNVKQTFQPPTGSVVITNGEAQLRQVIENAKQSRQQLPQ